MRNSRIPSALASLTKPHQTHADSSTDSIRPDALAGLWLILEVLSLTRVSLCLVGSLKLEPADDGALNEMSESGFVDLALSGLLDLSLASLAKARLAIFFSLFGTLATTSSTTAFRAWTLPAGDHETAMMGISSL